MSPDMIVKGEIKMIDKIKLTEIMHGKIPFIDTLDEGYKKEYITKFLGYNLLMVIQGNTGFSMLNKMMSSKCDVCKTGAINHTILSNGTIKNMCSECLDKDNK